MIARSLLRAVRDVRTSRGTLFVLSAPSGGGKTTLVRHLLARLPRLTRSVSVTTRPRRHGERQRRDYHFVSRAQFFQARAQGHYLEWAKVHEHFYATPLRPVETTLARGYDVVLVIDVQGAIQVKRHLPLSVAMFLLPPSWKALEQRLRQRATDDPLTIRRRLRVARQEVRMAKHYDYIVINDRLGQAVDTLAAIVTAERHRVAHEPSDAGKKSLWHIAHWRTS